MKDLLKDLCSQGVHHAVTTLKPENTAQQLLNHFDIAQYFTLCEGADPSHTILIGDTVFDEQGAKENGIGFVAAAYGFGFSTPPECLFYAESVEALRNFLL